MDGLKRVIAGVGMMICGTIAVCTTALNQFTQPGLIFYCGLIFFILGIIIMITGFKED